MNHGQHKIRNCSITYHATLRLQRDGGVSLSEVEFGPSDDIRSQLNLVLVAETIPPKGTKAYAILDINLEPYDREKSLIFLQPPNLNLMAEYFASWRYHFGCEGGRKAAIRGLQRGHCVGDWVVKEIILP